MGETKIRAIKGLVFWAVLWLLPTAGRAATTTVDCSSAGLQAAIEKVKPGDTLLVSGTCKENLVIYEEVARITLDGQGKATIEGADARRTTIVVRGRGITIKGFTVTGGNNGITVTGGGNAVIDGNTVQGTGFGITVDSSSSGRIANNTVQSNRLSGIAVANTSFAIIASNTIRNNQGQGIAIATTSAAWVGFFSFEDKSPSPNIVENNGSNGIEVVLSSSARIVGNTIRSNKRNGIFVQRASSALISNNTVDANGESGIDVARNAHAGLGRGIGTEIFRQRNSTASSNVGVGIRCSSTSSVEGQLGSLNGNKGVKDIHPSCADGLTP